MSLDDRIEESLMLLRRVEFYWRRGGAAIVEV